MMLYDSLEKELGESSGATVNTERSSNKPLWKSEEASGRICSPSQQSLPAS
jgi:hypothetical protein